MNNNEEIIEEGTRLKAAILAGLLAIAGSTGAFAKAKNTKLTPEQKIEQVCKDMPKEISAEEFKAFMKKYLEALGYDPEDKMTYMAYVNNARDTLSQYGITQKGVKKTLSGGYSFVSEEINYFNY